MFRNLVASDEAVKSVFDHFRNIGIAGAVLAAGGWNLTHSSTGFLAYVKVAAGLSLCALGLFLLIVAERHGHRKFKESRLPWYWELVVRVVYSLSLISLFTAALQH